jgi:hypothetical protein
LNRTCRSRQGKSGTVAARHGLSRQKSPAPYRLAEPGPKSTSVGVAVSLPMWPTLVSTLTSSAERFTRCQSCARSSRQPSAA